MPGILVVTQQVYGGLFVFGEAVGRVQSVVEGFQGFIGPGAQDIFPDDVKAAFFFRRDRSLNRSAVPYLLGTAAHKAVIRKRSRLGRLFDYGGGGGNWFGGYRLGDGLLSNRLFPFYSHQQVREAFAHTVQPGGRDEKKRDSRYDFSGETHAAADESSSGTSARAASEEELPAGENYSGEGQPPGQDEGQGEAAVEPFAQAPGAVFPAEFYAPDKQEGHYAQGGYSKTVGNQEMADGKAGTGRGVLHLGITCGCRHALILPPGKEVRDYGQGRNHGTKQYQGYA